MGYISVIMYYTNTTGKLHFKIKFGYVAG